MKELFKAVTVKNARQIISNYFSPPQEGEEVELLYCLNRCLLHDVPAAEDVPGFNRSTMDGFAVRARDTFGASESLPAYLEVSGEVTMGSSPEECLKPGQALRIATGGMLPEGADAVIMVEYTEKLDERTIGVTRPVAPGENIILRGEDFLAGEVILPAGHRLRPQDLGILAAAGVTRVVVRRPLRVGIISTGDEVIPPEEKPIPGQVRDVNSYTLFSAVAECGGNPCFYGIVKDDFNQMQERLSKALFENDLVLLSGGSSVGTRDVATYVIDSLGEPGVLFHGLSIKPGKPTAGATVNGKLIFGLPGHPASALVVFELLVAPLIRYGGYRQEDFWEFPLRARLNRNLRSHAGREDFIRVKLSLKNGELYAEPVMGKSGLINTMVKADGLAKIPAEKEGIEAGEWVGVKLF